MTTVAGSPTTQGPSVSHTITNATVDATDPAPTATPSTAGPTYTAFPPIGPVNAGAQQCGSFDLTVGAPTTFVPPPQIFDCLKEAFAAGAPATLVVSGGMVGDWDAIIHPIVRTFYEVTGPSAIRVTTDTRVPEGQTPTRTVEVCSGLPQVYPSVRVTGCFPA